MSIWSLDAFDESAGIDFLEQADGLGPIRESLLALAEAEPSALLGEEMVRDTLVSAEAIAALHDLPAADLPEPAARRIGNLDSEDLNDADAVLAYNAIARLRTRSELAEIWEERDATLWFGAIDGLLARLETIATPGGE